MSKLSMTVSVLYALLLVSPIMAISIDTTSKQKTRTVFKKQGIACLTGSALCALGAYTLRDSLNEPLTFAAYPVINIDFFKGLKNMRFVMQPRSESARCLLLGLASAYLGTCGVLCFIKPKWAQQINPTL